MYGLQLLSNPYYCNETEGRYTRRVFGAIRRIKRKNEIGVEMIKTKLVDTKKLEIVDAICNKCGESVYKDFATDAHLKADYDVYSKDFRIENFKFVICHECLKEMFKIFKIQPETEEVLEI